MDNEAAALAQEGAQRALDHAERVIEAWGDRAYTHALAFIAGQDAFTGEQVRAYAENHGLPPAPEPRAWGAVMLRLKRDGRTVFRGYDLSANKQAHNRPVVVWGVA